MSGGSRNANGEDDQQQEHTSEPGDLARLLVGAERHDADHVDDRGDDNEAGAEEVKSPENASEGDALHDVADAVVRRFRRRHVIHREEDPGDQLHRQQHDHADNHECCQK